MKTSLIWVHSCTREELTKLLEILNCEILLKTNSIPKILCATRIDKILLEKKFNENDIFSIEELANNFTSSKRRIYKNLTIEEQQYLLELSTYSFFQNPFIKNNLSGNTGPRAKKSLDVVSEYLILKSILNEFLSFYQINYICCLNPLTTVGGSLKFISKEKNIDIFYWEKGLEKDSVIIDNIGVNFGSHLSNKLNSLSSGKDNLIKNLDFYIPNENFIKKKILVTLQMENDSNIKIYSEIKSTVAFLLIIEELLEGREDIEIIIRKHPRENLTNEQELIINKNSWTISKENDFSKDILKADYVFVLNSTTGYESIKMEKYTFMFANSIYSNIFDKNTIKLKDIELNFHKYNPSDSNDINLREKLIKIIKQNSLFMRNLNNVDYSNFKNEEDLKKKYSNSFILEENLSNEDNRTYKRNSIDKVFFNYYKNKLKKLNLKIKKILFKKLSKNKSHAINKDVKYIAFTLETNSKNSSNILIYLWKDLCEEDISNKLIRKPFTDINLLKNYLISNPKTQVLVMGQGLIKILWDNFIDLSNVSVYYTHTLLSQNDFEYIKKVNHIYYMNSNSFAELVAAGIPPKKCSLLRLGVNRKIFKSNEKIDRDIDILFVQSYFEKQSYQLRKRFKAILKIAHFFSKKGKKVAVIGKNWDTCKSNHDFHYYDYQHKETPEILNRSKIYMNVAFHEGGCISLLEGLAMDCYVITCRTGFAHDMHDEIERVSTFPADSSIESIISKTSEVLDQNLWKKKSEEKFREIFLEHSEFKYYSKLISSKL